jgi:riboflavin biosynthesis pyrimidine reductase
MVLDDEAVTWRVRNGLPPQPVFALISGSLRLDADSSIFTQAPTRPVVYTTATADAERRALLETVADVVQVGEVGVDPLLIKEDLVARGLTHIHGEGGPHVFGSFIEAGAVDELCLTLAPTLEGGSAGRLSASATSAPTNMDLKLVLAAGDELLLRYAKRPADSSA